MNKLPIVSEGFDGGMCFQNKKQNGTPTPLKGFFFVTIVLLIVYISRLFQLTVVKGAYYEKLSTNNRIREIIIEPARGTILDRKGEVLARNVQYETEIDGRVPSRRVYTNPEAFAHVIGYRQIADDHDISSDPCIYKLLTNDKTGKKGVEKTFECELRGVSGKKITEVDAMGKYVQTLSKIPPIAGKQIQLSLDKTLQEKAYELIKDSRAVVVVLKPTTGELLALVSSPSYNPQFFEDREVEQTARYVSDDQKPLFNRATEGVYPPGSTFKLAVATAALEERVIDSDATIEDTGTILAGAQQFGTWYFLEHGRKEGLVDMITAIRRSNDIYFYKVGELLGPTKIKDWATKLGLSNTFELPIPEKEGVVPSEFWKEETLGERWYLGDTYNLSIGQGYVSVSPLQVAVMTATIANNGTKCDPTLLKSQTDDRCKKLDISDETLAVIHEGMTEACTPGGTGWPLFNFAIHTATDSARAKTPLPVACKTGTSESHDPSGKPHAWFTAYAPIAKPELAVTVLVEAAGQGSDVAAPIAKELFKTYFEREE